MDVEETKLITTFISAWAWQILAMLFLCSSLIIFSIERTLITQVMYIALFLIFIGCEFMSLKRKRNVLEEAE